MHADTQVNIAREAHILGFVSAGSCYCYVRPVWQLLPCFCLAWFHLSLFTYYLSIFW